MPNNGPQRRGGESIATPSTFSDTPSRAPGDTFDDFLKQTGGDPAPRGGHQEAISDHLRKINDFGKEPRPGYGPAPEPETFSSSPEGILPAVQPE